ncbi:MAG: hypothetical protein KOO64_02065, partial [Desulfobacterales bacterium]|nr:hypothetical protein [Desulfobacterales bacterium]
MLQVFLRHNRQSGKPAAVLLLGCCRLFFVSIYKNIIMGNDYNQSIFFVNKNIKGFKVLFDFSLS